MCFPEKSGNPDFFPENPDFILHQNYKVKI